MGSLRDSVGRRLVQPRAAITDTGTAGTAGTTGTTRITTQEGWKECQAVGLKGEGARSVKAQCKIDRTNRNRDGSGESIPIPRRGAGTCGDLWATFCGNGGRYCGCILCCLT